MSVQCEVQDDERGFRFRLVDGEQSTLWCTYTMMCYLNGWVAATQYYLPRDYECRPITPDEFCRLTASGIVE